MGHLSEQFFRDLQTGNLSPLLERVRQDNTLMLAIRKGYITIYYRGGSLLKIQENKSMYAVSFDHNYNTSPGKHRILSLDLLDSITTIDDANSLIGHIPQLKEIMDFHITANPKEEREYRQVVVRENNYSSISNGTEYFILDTEIEDTILDGQFVLSGIKWDAQKRQHLSTCKPVFIEMKYGDSSLGGTAGLLSQLERIGTFVHDRPNYEHFLKSMEEQFKQLDTLNLIQFKHPRDVDLHLDPDDKPEFIFLLANHNPRASKLKSILTDPHFQAKANAAPFELLFSVTSFAGYSLHSRSMYTLDQMIAFLSVD